MEYNMLDITRCNTFLMHTKRYIYIYMMVFNIVIDTLSTQSENLNLLRGRSGAAAEVVQLCSQLQAWRTSASVEPAPPSLRKAVASCGLLCCRVAHWDSGSSMGSYRRCCCCCCSEAAS